MKVNNRNYSKNESESGFLYFRDYYADSLMYLPINSVAFGLTLIQVIGTEIPNIHPGLWVTSFKWKNVTDNTTNGNGINYVKYGISNTVYQIQQLVLNSYQRLETRYNNQTRYNQSWEKYQIFVKYYVYSKFGRIQQLF